MNVCIQFTLIQKQKLYSHSFSLLHVMSIRFLMKNANAGLMSRLRRHKIKSGSRWWWVWGGGYYWEQFIVGAIRPCCSVWNERPSEETLSLPPNDNNTAGENIAESRLLHLPHFIFKTHHMLRFHSTTALFWDSSVKHTNAGAIRCVRHLEWTLGGKCKRRIDVCCPSWFVECLIFELTLHCILNNKQINRSMFLLGISPWAVIKASEHFSFHQNKNNKNMTVSCYGHFHFVQEKVSWAF